MKRICPYTKKIIDHKVSRIFSSPCICYAEMYAGNNLWRQNNYKIVLQTRVTNERIDCVVVGPETCDTIESPSICKNG